MTKVIIIGTQETDAGNARALEMVRSASIQNTTIISGTRPAQILASEQYMSPTESSLGQCLADAVAETKDEAIVLINSAALNQLQSAETVLTELLSSNGSTVRYVSIENDAESVSFPEAEVENLVSMLASNQSTPAVAMSIPTRIASQEKFEELENAAEAFARLFIQAAAAQEAISSVTGESSDTSKMHTKNSLSNSARSRAIQLAMGLCNIEDLFPNHSWEAHGAESASACYHTLAAIFVRLGELDLASQCLTYSDQFEDSPRSLALQGLIALKRGETLGAVAKMISSLQQYELRKKDSGEHYLSFAPENFENINANLQAGLDALNKRDNDKALQFFSAAVFQFDPFYRDTGVTEASKSH